MIPPLDDGVLPEGVHDCSIDEVEEHFGRPQKSTVRVHLSLTLQQLVKDAKASGIVGAIVVDGSFVTAKDEPEDIDVIVALRPDLDLKQELRPFEYDLASKRRLKAKYKFDAFVEVDGSEGYHAVVAFFAQVRSEQIGVITSRTCKGMLRIVL